MCLKTHKRKKGFSLAETVVALTLITIVFSMTVTSILAVSKTYKKAENVRFFVNEINNYLECYKMEGADNFTQNVNDYLFSDERLRLSPPSSESYDLIICYGEDYGKTYATIVEKGGIVNEEIFQKASFTVRITIDNSFYAVATDGSGERVFSLPKPYVSRYDYGK